jgi:DNA-binding IclR family transcriptional regulator
MNKSELPPPEKLVGALSNGLSVLRYLSKVNGRVGVTRVARDLDIHSSTCFNLLRTLVHERVVSFDTESKTYALALGLVELAKGALEQASYARMVHADLEALVMAHRVTATLWQRVESERVVLVDRAESSAAIRVHMSIGQRLPMFIAALGRCMAANSGLSRAQLKKRYAALRWEEAPGIDQFLEEVDRARTDGYAIDPGRYVKGVTTVSAAVLDAHGLPIMAISTIGFSAQFNDQQLVALACDVRDRARTVTRAISGGVAPVSR